MTQSDRIMKRCFDIALSTVGLLLLWPVICGAAILARRNTGASGFFRQVRVGKDGCLFTVLKIRTMRPIDGSSVTTAGDKRITPLGAKLRRWKIDELPQLLNVLKGEMSFVGPRPDVPGYIDQLEGEDWIVATLRPGITGPATLKYRNEELLLAEAQDPQRYNDEVIWPDKVRINRAYIERYRFRDDLRYIWITLVGR